MQKLILKPIFFIFLIISLFSFNSFSQETKLIASCCEEGRGCTGSAYCTACKNCSGCRYCSKNGGSCGVCSSVRKKTYRNSSSLKKITADNSSISYKFYRGAVLYTSKTILNLRKGPGVKYKVLKKLKKDTKLVYISKKNNWIKVKEQVSDLVGYVYFKYLY